VIFFIGRCCAQYGKPSPIIDLDRKAELGNAGLELQF
jgi:hypothetical protein